MRVAIRADASTAIGSGHVMRCLTLASALRVRGHRVIFLSRPRPGDLFERIAATGFDVVPLPATKAAERTWLGASLEQEVAQMRASLTRSPTDLLVVDQYALGASWEREMRAHAGRIAVIDDLMDRPHECDLLLDQNLRDDALPPYAGLVPAGTKLLLGPRFALLREEFRVPLQRSRRRSGTIARVLVSMGGFDAQDVTSVVLQALEHPALAQALSVDVVLPLAAPHAGRVRGRVEGMPNARYLGTVENMAELLERADLAIGGAGTSAWERMALGVPALVITLAANQESGARACQRAGVSVTVGAIGAVQAPQVTDAVLALMRDPALVTLMSDRGRAIMRTGEFGTDAVARNLEQLFLEDSTDN